ncbi:anti-sigma factor family protein [Streptomyces sp. NBC_00344]|uniref:anti-sigma factor family protein n=1 Tax=Streptomyces sp. NBC_00344 TaxID=2975720 RepID=UPI002E215153
MSGSSPTPAEQHLGDRLAALVDGELNHDARERVLAHLATCPRCKTEADAQRRLKSVFAETAPPPPSEGLLARLQGLPGGPGDDSGRGGPFGGGRLADEFFGQARSSGRRSSDPRLDTFGHLPAGAHGAAVPDGGPGTGFRIHPVGRPGQERTAWRGRRFAFVAASAFSLAAIALGGTLPLDGPGEPAARTEGNGSNVTPLSTTEPVGASAAADRRRGGEGDGVFATHGYRQTPGRLLPPTTFTAGHAVSAATAPPVRPLLYSLTTPLLSTVPVPPVIRPSGVATPTARTTQPSPAATPAPVLLAVPSAAGLPVSRQR